MSASRQMEGLDAERYTPLMSSPDFRSDNGNLSVVTFGISARRIKARNTQRMIRDLKAGRPTVPPVRMPTLPSSRGTRS